MAPTPVIMPGVISGREEPWQPRVHRVTKIQTQLKPLSMHAQGQKEGVLRKEEGEEAMGVEAGTESLLGNHLEFGR